MQRNKLTVATLLALLSLLSGLVGMPATVMAQATPGNQAANQSTIYLPHITGGSQMADASAGTVTTHHPAWECASMGKFTELCGLLPIRMARLGSAFICGWKDANAAEALARAVSDPKSPSYRQYVNAAQFRQKFAPSQSDVKAVQSWLKDQGFDVVYTPTNNHYVAAEGTVAQAQNAFSTQFGNV